jgi:predicted SprT family Zn-dependent metalloprotease
MSAGRKTADAVENPIRCTNCGLFYEKGAKPQKGQNDSFYVCDNCAEKLKST